METQVLALIPAYIAYIVILGLYMFVCRLQALKDRSVSLKEFRTYQGEQPERLKALQNHFSNQFEVPILFFITCITAVLLGKATEAIFYLGLLFFVIRFLHSYIHLTFNKVQFRALSYFASFIVVLVMWIVILI